MLIITLLCHSVDCIAMYHLNPPSNTRTRPNTQQWVVADVTIPMLLDSYSMHMMRRRTGKLSHALYRAFFTIFLQLIPSEKKFN